MFVNKETTYLLTYLLTYFHYFLFTIIFLFYLEWIPNVFWPRLTYKRVEPVVSISWASCCQRHDASITWNLVRHVFVTQNPPLDNHWLCQNLRVRELMLIKLPQKMSVRLQVSLLLQHWKGEDGQMMNYTSCFLRSQVALKQRQCLLFLRICRMELSAEWPSDDNWH